MEYRSYSAEQFAQDESFIAWVKKSDAKAIAFWEEFFQTNPGKQSEIYEAIKLIDEMKFEDDLSPREEDEEWDRLLGKIAHEDKKKRKPHFIRWAAVLIPFILAFLAFQYFDISNKTIVTAYGETKYVVLPDSTEVVINANSTLSYEITNKSREVWIDGEAFFDVNHIKNNGDNVNFIVHADNADVEVLGTSFNVNSRREKVKVVLNSGEIKLSYSDSTLIMAPGQMAEIYESNATIKQVNPSFYSAWKENKIKFESIPLSEIITMLEDNYGLQIEVKTEQNISQMHFQGTFLLDQDIHVFLEILAESFDFKLKKKDDKVIFYHS